ncbi:MAG: hypothetical protein ACJAWL_001077 [Motiliproteus sp.]|jgi:hypothetical protein
MGRMITILTLRFFYNSKRRHGFNNKLPPIEYEELYGTRLMSVYIIGGDSTLCSEWLECST